MQLDLVDGRADPGLAFEPFQILDAEVGDSDRAGAAFFVDALEGAPGFDEAVLRRNWPVDQVEVDVVEAEPPEALLERGQGRVVALARVPQLGGDEDLLAGDPRRGYRRPDPALVAVRGGGVDVPVADCERLLDHPLGLLRWHLEDAEA